MALLKPGIKSRLETVTELIKTSYHVAFIPFVIYMGFQKGPEFGGPAFGLLRAPDQWIQSGQIAEPGAIYAKINPPLAVMNNMSPKFQEAVMNYLR